MFGAMSLVIRLISKNLSLSFMTQVEMETFFPIGMESTLVTVTMEQKSMKLRFLHGPPVSSQCVHYLLVYFIRIMTFYLNFVCSCFFRSI